VADVLAEDVKEGHGGVGWRFRLCEIDKAIGAMVGRRAPLPAPLLTAGSGDDVTPSIGSLESGER
jgi:hypothetical protein